MELELGFGTWLAVVFTASLCSWMFGVMFGARRIVEADFDGDSEDQATEALIAQFRPYPAIRASDRVVDDEPETNLCEMRKQARQIMIEENIWESPDLGEYEAEARLSPHSMLDHYRGSIAALREANDTTEHDADRLVAVR